MEEITRNINSIIEDSDERTDALALAIGCNRKQITRWKNGEQEMGIYKLKAFCEFYGVSADYVLGLPKNLAWPR